MNWWARFWRRNAMEEQLEKELRFHLEQHTTDLIAAGHSPTDATRQARLALGGPEQVKENCRQARGTRWAEDLIQDARYALRMFRQKPGFTAVTLLTLVIGIGATTIMFAVVNSVLLKPLSFRDANRLVVLDGFGQLGEFWGFSEPDFLDIKNESRSLDIAAWTYGGGTISAPGEPEYVDGRQISAELLPTLGVDPAYGRAFRSDEDRPGAAPVAIISYRLWQRRFGGNRSSLGQRLVYDGKAYLVIGIAPPGFQLAGECDVFTALGQSTDPRLQNRQARFLHVVARLCPRITFTQAHSEIALIGRHLAEEYPKSNADVSMRVHPLLEELVSDVRGTLLLLLSAVALVLLIGCVNIASLLLTRAISRERELAMRVALGARRSRLVRQCITESAVLGLCGGLLGILAARLSIRPFLALWPGDLPRAEEIQIDWHVLAFAIGVSLLSALLFGLAPALRVPMHGLERALRAGGRSVTGASRHLHSPFVITQIALAFVLLVSAGMLARTLLKLSSLSPNVKVDHLLTARFALSPAGARRSLADTRSLAGRARSRSPTARRRIRGAYRHRPHARRRELAAVSDLSRRAPAQPAAVRARIICVPRVLKGDGHPAASGPLH